MYVGSCCDVVYRSCDVGHPSTDFPPSTSFFHPLPHKPFFKRHLLKAIYERDTRQIARTMSTEFPPSTQFFRPLPHNPFFKRHLLKANCERDTMGTACNVSRVGGRTNRNSDLGCSHVNDVLKIRLPHPCRWMFVVVFCAWWMRMTDIKGSFGCRICMYVCWYPSF
jgi:hypothetical protein